jgi:Bifunctional DNA primase/polymerase, N-terminal
MSAFGFQPPISDTALAWALAYAAAKMAVFPVGANGVPALSRAEGGRGFKDATTDPDQIKIWWKRWPHAEIAWAVPAGVVVVDLDVKKGKRGLKDFFDREKIEPDAVETPIAVTPSGGRHLVFDDLGNPYRNDVAIGGTGIDLRSAGLGYIVLARKGNGRFWLKPLTTPLAPAPAWLPVKPPDRPAGEVKPFSGEASPNALEALDAACTAILSAPCGAQERTLNSRCFLIGRRVGAGQLNAEAAIATLSAAAAHMTAHRGPWHGLDSKVRRAVEHGMLEPWRDNEPRDEPLTFNGVMGLAQAVAKASPEKRRALTRWGARRLAENVRAGKISAQLAHLVLFEAATRNGLPATEAGSIIETVFRGNSRG